MRCPRCLISLAPDEDDGVTCRVCPQCHGTWISGTALQRLMAKAVTPAPAEGVQPQPSAGDGEQGEVQPDISKTLYCADCETAMVRERFHPMIAVQVERCEKCGYVWLDAGERELLMRLYHDLVTDTDPQVATRRKELQRLSDLENAPPPDAAEFDRDLGLARTATLGATAVIVRLLVAFLAV